MSQEPLVLEGGCACGAVRYRLTREPLIVHACHCRNCQNQTGAWHAVNALIETRFVEVTRGVLADWELPTPSGAGQTIRRCVECGVAVWSNYHLFSQGKGDRVRFIRVGTLDTPERLPTDVHIFASERNAAAPEPVGAPRYPEFYPLREVWRPESLDRLQTLFGSPQAQRKRLAEVAG